MLLTKYHSSRHVFSQHVVREALRSAEARSASFTLASSEDVLPTWPRRGLAEEMCNEKDASSVIRCSPDHDATNGFFVSCFTRASKQESHVTLGKRKSTVLGDEVNIGQSRKAKRKRELKEFKS